MILFDIAFRERVLTHEHEAIFRRYLADTAFRAHADERLSHKHRQALEVLASEPGANVPARIVSERLYEIRQRLRDALSSLNEVSTIPAYPAAAPSPEPL